MARIIHSGSLLVGDKTDAAYDLLAHMPGGLCLDVGAAAGKASARWVRTNPALRVLAFEPFKGNHPHFDRNCGALDQVRLIPKAVGSFDGPGRVFVASTLTNPSGAWAGYDGYSSSGMLISQGDRRWEDARTDEVEVCRLDSVTDEPVRLLKIDVQGGEAGVLEGAQRLFDGPGVDLVYVEFSGEREILDFLFARGYAIFDNLYVYSPTDTSPPAEALGSFKASTLSSGRSVYRGTLHRRSLSADDMLALWAELPRDRLQTDLLAVRPGFLPTFLRACAAHLQPAEARELSPA